MVAMADITPPNYFKDMITNKLSIFKLIHSNRMNLNSFSIQKFQVNALRLDQMPYFSIMSPNMIFIDWYLIPIMCKD